MVGVVDGFEVRFWFGKKDCASTKVGFAVDLMRRDQACYLFGQQLFASIIGYRCLHYFRLSFVRLGRLYFIRIRIRLMVRLRFRCTFFTISGLVFLAVTCPLLNLICSLSVKCFPKPHTFAEPPTIGHTVISAF